MPDMTQHQRLLIVDFGSQVTQLIARRLRELNIYCEIHPYQNVTDAFLRAVREDKPWELIRRTDGKVAKTVSARERVAAGR